MATGVVSLGVKRPGCEVDHSPPSNYEVKNECSYTNSLPTYPHGVDMGGLYLFIIELARKSEVTATKEVMADEGMVEQRPYDRLQQT
jgi:hypothetical protein